MAVRQAKPIEIPDFQMDMEVEESAGPESAFSDWKVGLGNRIFSSA